MTAPHPIDLDPARLGAWLGHGMSANLLARMLAVPRLEAGCNRLLQERLGPWPDPGLNVVSTKRMTLVRQLDGLALLWLAQQAGAVWHARLILRAIDGVAVRDLVTVIGATLRLVAIRHAFLAPEEGRKTIEAEAQAEDEPADPHRLAERIAQDGLGCFAAWCDAQPAAVGQRLLLRLPGPGIVPAPYRTHGPAILDALLDHPA